MRNYVPILDGPKRAQTATQEVNVRRKILGTLAAGAMVMLASLPRDGAFAAAPRSDCFSCQLAPSTCGTGYHVNFYAFGASDIWQGNFHNLNWCIEGSCSSDHSWYYNCGEGNEECGGGLCSPTQDSLAVLEGSPEFDAAIVRMAAEKPERFHADPERGLIRGIACSGSVAATYRVSRETALAVLRVTAPELLEFHE
jgi:hypothetical protein